jgi:hypothetical protein
MASTVRSASIELGWHDGAPHVDPSSLGRSGEPGVGELRCPPHLPGSPGGEFVDHGKQKPVALGTATAPQPPAALRVCRLLSRRNGNYVGRGWFCSLPAT